MGRVVANNAPIKQAVLSRISQGKERRLIGKATYSIGGVSGHVRYCAPPTYKFNLNPNTLRADYELWVCGNQNDYFLIPKEVIRSL